MFKGGRFKEQAPLYGIGRFSGKGKGKVGEGGASALGNRSLGKIFSHLLNHDLIFDALSGISEREITYRY